MMRGRRVPFSKAMLVVVLVVVGSAVFATPALGDTYEVVLPIDSSSASCPGSDCTLRSAVITANNHPGPDTIALVGNSDFNLTIAASGTDDASTGDLNVSGDLTIEPEAGGTPVIDAMNNDRVFDVHSGTLTLRGITVEGGAARANQNGGGIEVEPGTELDVLGGEVTGNSVTTQGQSGGGIWNDGATVNIHRATVQSNTVVVNGGGGVGGGIYTSNDGTTNVYDSRFFDNHADGGGALGSFNTNASVAVLRSQLSFNTAVEDGGAVYNGLSGAHYDFNDTTINDNTAGGFGGAIRVRDAFVTSKSSTITGNQAADGGGIAAQDDGGSPTTYVTLADTILARNTDSDTTSPTVPDCYDQSGGLFHSSGYNIVGDTTGCTNDLAVFPATGDQLGSSLSPIDPKLKTENFNGGNFVGVETFQPKPTSPAINAGDPATSGGCVSTDARSVPRKLGGRCDIGAYELVKCAGTVVNRVAAPEASFDELSQTPGPDGFLGFGRIDSFNGGDGNDALCGQGNDDLLIGGNNSDHLLGGSGNDTLEGDGGNDVLNGGNGDDHLIGGPGHDVCIGGPGHDTATGCEVTKGIP
jgi:predicted outer membrane repeat protein